MQGDCEFVGLVALMWSRRKVLDLNQEVVTGRRDFLAFAAPADVKGKKGSCSDAAVQAAVLFGSRGTSPPPLSWTIQDCFASTGNPLPL